MCYAESASRVGPGHDELKFSKTYPEDTRNEALIVRSLLAENDHLRIRQFWMAGIFFVVGTLVGHFVPQLF